MLGCFILQIPNSPVENPTPNVCAKDISSFMHLNFTRTYSAIEQPQPASYFTVKHHTASRSISD